MFWSGFSDVSLWWLFPLMMMVLCFIMMKGRKGSMMCGCGSRGEHSHTINTSDSAMDILDKRYANGEINMEEYEKKKIILTWDK